jgi:hypothetical protein
MTSGKNPRAPPYFQGRFTNAPGNWVDQLVASAPELAVANFAFGGGSCEGGLNVHLSQGPLWSWQVWCTQQSWLQ